MKTNIRKVAAARRVKERQERQIAKDHERAASRLAIVLGMCPSCGALALSGETHTNECSEVR